MTSAGGGQHRRDYIAISLFGTDEITKGKKRIHGYSVSKLVIDNDNAKIILWPLQREKRDSGRYTIDRDGSYELNEDG
ncbi:MAG: hypothetical protein L7F77_11615, partial [Candidatus Magnetominusculus sp. LBB02]|nr:hypothetical protein [Candidatus Magnetominusculus sp. LBB02]